MRASSIAQKSAKCDVPSAKETGLFHKKKEPIFCLTIAKERHIENFSPRDVLPDILDHLHADCMSYKTSPLEERTLAFAGNIRSFIEKIPYSRISSEDCKQLLRSSGSIGANYLEAQEALSRKDFFYRVRVARKEAGESRFWLKLLANTIPKEYRQEAELLQQESVELFRILTAIAKKEI